MNEEKRKGGQVHAVCTTLFLILTTSLCFIPILCIGILKLVPIKRWQTLCTRGVDAIATFWCGINNFYVNTMKNVRWEIYGLDNVNKKDWNLVVANHQSWLDIVILQRVFNRKIPVLKFFIKDQLKWVPFLGFAWWAMGCPFMKRYSKEYLAKKPHKKGKDIISTNKAIDIFKRAPASIMNFVEGTRFSYQKKEAQNSPYNHLLRPKAGGISYIVQAMGQQIHSLIDVTIIYPKNHKSLWDFLCKRVESVKISVRQLPIPSQFRSDKLMQDPKILNDFKEWLNQQWAEKDNLIASLQE